MAKLIDAFPSDVDERDAGQDRGGNGRLTAEAAASADEVEAWHNPWKNRTVLMARSW
jgi:hypothetical protein